MTLRELDLARPRLRRKISHVGGVAAGGRASVIVLAAQLEAMRTLIGSIEKRIKTQHRSNEVSQGVETIPGIAPPSKR